MSIPAIDDLTTPLLEELADGAERSTRALKERLALRFGLSGAELARRGPDGGTVFDDRVMRARAWLRRHRLIDYPLRGHARITAAGLERLGIGHVTPGPDESSFTLVTPLIGAGPLESELRALTGSAAHDEADWAAICLLAGWGPEGILSCSEVAERISRPVEELRPLAGPHAREGAAEGPILDAVLAFA
ncbi:MAG TPA: winged helix-turn-helix domain-containing protein, partial [Coriobacteriia bacterium]|nr:winged helix-turn-helix domain-containing protein [Coriobacteriia bacterium]